MKKIFTFLLLLCCMAGFSQSTTIVISQVYGAGGNSGALFNADYVELHNISATSQSLNGLSVQYESATPAGNWSGAAVLPNVSIPAGGYFLVQMTAAGSVGSPLPTPDFVGDVAMGGTNGIVAIINGVDVITGCPSSNVIDLVGYGTAACFEGAAASPGISATLAAFRLNNGCTDTNVNGNDFSTGAPAPRNSASPAFICGSGPTPQLTITGTINDFGSLQVGNTSASQTYNLSGSNLTGAPGNIVVSAPSADFQVSGDNSTWTASVNIPFTSATLASTPVYVRFSPQSAGLKSGNVTNSGGGAATVNVAVSGTGTSSGGGTGTLVISQFYGAGGNTGAVLNADYVEIHNISAVSQSLNGLSVQYESATPAGTWSGAAVLPNVSIPPGGFYLVQMTTTPGSIGAPLPTPDFAADVLMGGSNGIVAIINGTTVISGCPSTDVIDLVGYGTAACFEGGGAAPAVSATLAGFRADNGCTDTDNNNADFSTGAPAPRNSASPVQLCSSAPTPTLTVTGTIADFGNVDIGTNSTSQSYSLSGANLTGAPGVITVSAPSLDFQVSNDNSTWGASTTLAYTSATLSATNVWVRFTPQTAGPKSGNVTNAGGGAATVNVPVSGNGTVPATPTLTASTISSFGNVCIGTVAGPNSFTINGTNLTNANINIAALPGFSYATTSGGPFSSTLSLTQPGGTYSQQIFVQFNPTASQSYDGNIAISGAGANAINVAASGLGNNNPPTVSTGAASAVTSSSATLAGSITDNGCTTVSAYGITYSLVNGFTTGTDVASTNISSGSFTSSLTGLLPSTTYYYKAYATNDGGTAYGLQQSFTTAAPVLTVTSLNSFGSLCVNTSSDAQNFTITSPALTTANVVVGPLAGYSFATTETGTFAASLNITQPGGAFTQVVYVKFTPVAIQSYNGNIPVSGGGAATVNVSVSGSGYNAPADIVTMTASNITVYTATLGGSITSTGCSEITSAGIEYSGISNLGIYTRVQASNVTASDFSVNLSGLVQATKYYYRAYAINDGGIAYGAIDSFVTKSIPNGLTLYSIPATKGQALHFTYKTNAPGHYAVKLFNASGQLVFRKGFIMQLNFIDESFVIPSSTAPGVYMFVLENVNGFTEKRSILIQ